MSPRTAAGGRTKTETKHSSCCAVARKRLGPSRGPRERLPRQPTRSAPCGRDTPTTSQALKPERALRLGAKRLWAQARPGKTRTAAVRACRLSRDSFESWIESRVRPPRKRERRARESGRDCARPLNPVKRKKARGPELVVSLASRARLSLERVGSSLACAR